MPKYINESLMNVGNLLSIRGVVIHNDAGSGTPEWYVNWLRNRDKALGIAHYYINRDTIARVIDTNKIAYHCGDGVSSTSGNGNYIGYEVCQSMSASDKDFLANEDMTLMQATEDLLFYGLPIDETTVRLHNFFVPTSCPHRSMELHGGTPKSTQAYFIQRMKHFATLGKTVDEMIASQSGSSKQPSTEPNILGGLAMYFTYQITDAKDKDTIYYYNAGSNTIVALSNPDQLGIIRKIFKDTTGRDMPHYNWSMKAPWYLRFIQASKAKQEKAG